MLGILGSMRCQCREAHRDVAICQFGSALTVKIPSAVHLAALFSVTHIVLSLREKNFSEIYSKTSIHNLSQAASTRLNHAKT
jgi:hypothetical protein